MTQDQSRDRISKRNGSKLFVCCYAAENMEGKGKNLEDRVVGLEVFVASVKTSPP